MMKITREQLNKLVEEKPELVIDCLKSIYMDGDQFGEVTQFTIDTVDALKQALTQKPVDMSVLIDSPVDCVFWNREEEYPLIGECVKMIGNKFFMAGVGDFKYCKPRMDYPFSVELWFSEEVMIKFRDSLFESGFESTLTGRLNFRGSSEVYHSIKITGLRENYCFPWEFDQ